MKLLDYCPADAIADLVYQVCPMRLLEPSEFLRELHQGQVLEILTDYDVPE